MEQYLAAGLGDRDYFKGVYGCSPEPGPGSHSPVWTPTGLQRNFMRPTPIGPVVTRTNNPVIRQGRYVACVNSGYFREYLPAIITEIIESVQAGQLCREQLEWPGQGYSAIVIIAGK